MTPDSTSPSSAKEAPRVPRVVLIVLNWNGLADTLECLVSVRGLTYPNWDAIVVDNGSDDRQEARTIRAAFPSVTVLENDRNMGYAGGCNVGIRQALRQGADYVWLLNNDTEVAPDCLTQLVEAAESLAEVGLLSPVIYYYGARDDIQCSGSIIDRHREDQSTLTSLGATCSIGEAATLTLWGTAILLKRSVVESIGLLDERYFAYHEDLDYCLRALRSGFRTLVVPGGKIYHKSARSLGSEWSPVKEYLLVRNWYLLWRTHLTGWRRLTYPRRYSAWVLLRVLNARRAGQYDRADHALDGAWDAFRGQWGSWELKGKMPGILRASLVNGLLGWHPYFWIMLVGGDLAGLSSGTIKRMLRLRGSSTRQ